METEALAHNLEHLCRYWETRRTGAADREAPLPASPSFTIALSREAGAQGTSIARETGKRLGWLVYDNELLEEIAQDMGVRANLLRSVDERSLSWITEAFEASMPTRGSSDSPPSESAYSHHLIKTVLALGTHGNCVIVGRGAAFILPAATTLRVRLVGNLRERVAAWARRLSISEREAARQLRSIDRERIDFVQDHFLKDATDPRNYDLVLNAPRLSVAQNADVIVEALHRYQASVLEK